ncbi:MAG: hypothetical protein AAGF88_02570 [Pseudomonadota bacterium]
MTHGAGGTDGGIGAFVIGFLMMCAGGYMLLNGIILRPQFGWGMSVLTLRGVPITSGMIFVPFIFGIGIIFYNGRNIIGWALTIGSISAMIFGVIANTQIILARMTAFDLVVILVLLVGGIGLFLRSLRTLRGAV